MGGTKITGALEILWSNFPSTKFRPRHCVLKLELTEMFRGGGRAAAAETTSQGRQLYFQVPLNVITVGTFLTLYQILHFVTTAYFSWVTPWGLREQV